MLRIANKNPHNPPNLEEKFMKMAVFRYIPILLYVSAVIGLFLGGTAAVHAAKMRHPFNKVAIILDASGSYRGRQEEALQHALNLLEKKRADTKLSRWDHDLDQFAVISLDAMPEILWLGNAKDLKREGVPNLAARFKARTDYASCSDVAAAFSVAAKFVEGDSLWTRPAIIAYSDLIDEKPTHSLRACQKPQTVPTDFPWAVLQNIAVNVLWLPPDQKFTWQRAANEHGWNDVHLFTVSESSKAEIELAPKTVISRELVKTRTAEKWSSLVDVGSTYISWVAGFLGSAFLWVSGVIGLFIVTALFSRFRKRARRLAAQQSPRV